MRWSLPHATASSTSLSYDKTLYLDDKLCQLFTQDGYYGLTSQNPGCTACDCDLAGSFNTSCSSSGQCYCRPRFSGAKCDVIDPGFFVPSVDFMTFQAEDATPITVSIKYSAYHDSVDPFSHYLE